MILTPVPRAQCGQPTEKDLYWSPKPEDYVNCSESNDESDYPKADRNPSFQKRRNPGN